VWEGDATTTSNTFFPGVTITTSAHAIFSRDPEWEPGDSRISYFLTGGSFTWSIGGTSGDCTFEAGPIQVPLGVDDHSYISFDLKQLDAGIIGYYGMANLVDGRRVEVAKTCAGKSENYNTTAGGSWFLAPEDGEFVLDGTVAEGKWASGAVIHTDFSWRFAKSE
jgi:hypothetical protein